MQHDLESWTALSGQEVHLLALQHGGTVSVARSHRP
jgi:hypothetical protein